MRKGENTRIYFHLQNSEWPHAPNLKDGLYYNNEREIFTIKIKYVCVFVCVLCFRSGISGKNDNIISVEEIIYLLIKYFKGSDDLVGKPKLFFIQACRGSERGDSDVEGDNKGADNGKRLCPPESSDILVAHSTVERELSYRDVYTGSWFIQTLIKQINTHARSAHLMDIMTVVNNEIAESELKGYRQMPQQVSTLTKFVFFKMATVEEEFYTDRFDVRW